MTVNQDRPPNFRVNGKLYLVRCFNCGDPERGRENYLPRVASGECAFCGWFENGWFHEDRPARTEEERAAEAEFRFRHADPFDPSEIARTEEP